MRVARADAGKDFVALSLKDSSAIAARFSQETLSIGYGVGSKAIEVAIPVPAVRPALKKPDVIKSLRAQAACMTGGMFDACPDFMKLLESRQQTWPRFADAALPDAGSPLTTGSLPDVKVASAAAGLNLTASDVVAAVDRLERRSGEVIMGAASTYNPYDADDNDAGGAETASGELYNPIGWTAAIQTGMRGEFAGVRYGRLYKPSFALVEVDGRRAVVKINDVGPLRPGRVIDFSVQTMHYFDPSLQRGVLDDVDGDAARRFQLDTGAARSRRRAWRWRGTRSWTTRSDAHSAHPRESGDADLFMPRATRPWGPRFRGDEQKVVGMLS